MSTRADTPRVSASSLGGKWAGVLFVLVLLAFVIESQFTQYVQTTMGFRQPYFVFYCVHSAFSIMFPLHYLYLVIVKRHSSTALNRGLWHAFQQHVAPTILDAAGEFPTWGLARLIFLLSIAVSIPALLWFVAVTLAPLSDVTALWNTNAFFAYILTVKLFGLRWEPRRLASVLLATAGAAAVVYGGSSAGTGEEASAAAAHITSGPLVGDLLTLAASIVYGTYQVLYKIYAALPSDPSEIGVSSTDVSAYEPIASGEPDEFLDMPIPSDDDTKSDAMVYPPPFGLYANFITSGIGVCTFLLLWIPIPVLHVLDLEKFRLPTDITTISVIAAICLTGVVFNAGLMILLGLWGPVVTSVGNLLTIVLVFISDIVFGGAVQTITVWSLLGSGSIVAAFGILAFDMVRAR